MCFYDVLYCFVVLFGCCFKIVFTYFIFFFFNDTATTEIYTLSLHDALPILFCEKSEIEPHYIRRWMPLVAASQTVVANARSRAVLQRWIDEIGRAHV